MANSPYKYADGLYYLLFPGNAGYSIPGYNFPESTAMDEGSAGAIALSFIGSDIPEYTSDVYSWGYGPSGGYGTFTQLASFNIDSYFNWDYRGTNLIPNLDGTYGAYEFIEDVEPTTPDLMTLYKVDYDPVIENAYSTGDKNKTAFNSISEINVLDLVSEGPIEGLVTGSYIFNTSGKVAGDIGYTSYEFQPYEIRGTSLPESRSIYWNDTPITDTQGYRNFQFADYKYTYGEKTNDHTIYNPYINLYENRYNYFGRQVDKNKYPIRNSITRSINEALYGFYLISGNRSVFSPKTYYIYNTDISSIKVNIKINSLYEQMVTGSNQGDIERQTLYIRFKIYAVLKDGTLVLVDTSSLPPYEKDYWSIDDVLMKGKIQKSPFIMGYEFTLRPFAENRPSFTLLSNQVGYAIEIKKMTREFATASLSNSTTVDSITEVYSDTFTNPDSALIISKFDARYFSDIPTRSYKVKLLKIKIPVNYDPIARKYNGNWNGKFKIAWTDNPAWCFYDLVTNNRFGLGRYISPELADKWNLYEIAQYCDQLVDDGSGGLEPRFTCNLYINTKQEAYKILNDVASIFLGILYYSAGQIIVGQDSPKQAIYLFNNSNVLNGEFTYSDASKRARKTVAMIRYNDKNDNYKPALEYVEDRDSMLRFGIRETEIVAFGCVSKNQARRLGKWLLVTQNTETELVEFKAGLEANYLKPGDVISIYDQTRKNAVYAGRTLELNTGYAILDLPYNARNTYSITGLFSNVSFQVITPSYSLTQGTELGDLYMTGFSSITSSGITGLNSSLFRRSMIQSVEISNPKNYLTSGSGIYSNNIRINFPYINSIPENITPVNMSKVGNIFTKIAGTTWGDAEAYSSIGYNSNMYVEVSANQTTAGAMFGLSSNPTASANYDTINYAWHVSAPGTFNIYENGLLITSFGTYTTSTKFRIEYDGKIVTYFLNGAAMRSVSVPTPNTTYYFDSSFNQVGAAITANYGTFGLNNYLNILPNNTVWTMNLNPSGYSTIGLDTKSEVNNASNTLYPGYYLEPYLNKPKEYRVLSITEQTPETFTINALEYNRDKFSSIDNINKLENIAARPAQPRAPTLEFSGLFRDVNGSFWVTPGVRHYTTNQNGINSIIYKIIPPANSTNDQYYIYVKSGVNFSNNTTPSSDLLDVISESKLEQRIKYNAGDTKFPPYFTPLYAQQYFFKVFAANSIGERSSPATGYFRLLNQAEEYLIDLSGINVF
jgi:hypothetical protein